MIFEVLTLFPEGIEAFASQGLLGKAVKSGRIELHCTNYRDFSQDPHRKVDDIPYGGGAGMVMQPGPVVDALQAIEAARGRPFRVLLSPSGVPFTQAHAQQLASHQHLAFLCGRYEGIDDRVRERYVDACFSLGDFVLNGGEVAALAMIEAIARLKEGVLGNPASVEKESFAPGSRRLSLEHPHYTRPANFRGMPVPPVLTGGDHAKIEAWRRRIAVLRTHMIRPELRLERGLERGLEQAPEGGLKEGPEGAGAQPSSSMASKARWILADQELESGRRERLAGLASRHGWSYAEIGAARSKTQRFASLKTFSQRQRKQGPLRILAYRSQAWLFEHPEIPALPDPWQEAPPRSIEQAAQLQWAVAMELLFDQESPLPAQNAAIALYWPAEDRAPPDRASAKVDLSLGVAAAPAGIDLALCQRMIESPESHTPWEAMCDRLEALLARPC